MSYYDFIPYKYGPYSFQLKRDIDVLCSNSYLRKTSRGIYLDLENPVSETNTFLIASERNEDLLKKTYREYPYYAINSEILYNLFSASEIKIFSKKENLHRLIIESFLRLGTRDYL